MIKFNPDDVEYDTIMYNDLENISDCDLILLKPVHYILNENLHPRDYYELKGVFVKDYKLKGIVKNSIYYIQFSKKRFISAWKKCPLSKRDFGIKPEDNIMITFSNHVNVTRNKKKYNFFRIIKIRKYEGQLQCLNLEKSIS